MKKNTILYIISIFVITLFVFGAFGVMISEIRGIGGNIGNNNTSDSTTEDPGSSDDGSDDVTNEFYVTFGDRLKNGTDLGSINGKKFTFGIHNAEEYTVKIIARYVISNNFKVITSSTETSWKQIASLKVDFTNTFTTYHNYNAFLIETNKKFYEMLSQSLGEPAFYEGAPIVDFMITFSDGSKSVSAYFNLKSDATTAGEAGVTIPSKGLTLSTSSHVF